MNVGMGVNLVYLCMYSELFCDMWCTCYNLWKMGIKLFDLIWFYKEIFSIFTFTTFYIEMVVKISLFHNSQISQPFFAWFHNSQLILGPFLKSQLLFNSQFLNFFCLLSQFHNFLRPISQFSKTMSPTPECSKLGKLSR